MNPPAFQILLASSNPKLPQALSKLFQKDNLGFNVATSTDEALESLHNRPVDLVLIDLESLKTKGFELLRRLKTDPPPFFAVVLAIAAPKDRRGMLRAFELGATGCVSRPLDRLFRAHLRAYLETKHRHDELDRHNYNLTKARLAAETTAHAKSDFLAAMSHEIRTLMNGVVATVGLLSETPLTAEQRSHLETIHTGSESLLAIMNDILDFSKIEAGKWELDSQPFDLRACVEETLDLMSALAFEKNLDLVYQMDDEIPAVIEGDGLRLRQVLLNLLSNAIKFTKSGEVQVEVKLLSSKMETDQRHVLLHLHFSAHDTGIGIASDRLTQLFKPFTQAEASTAHHYGGTGLGLAISKRLVELMGGKMWAESVPGEGSTFHFTMNALAEPQTTPFALAGRQDKLAGLRILIVDDNAACLKALARQLTKWGTISQSAANAKQALDFMRGGEPFDLTILDADIPGTDVFALAGEIHQLSAGKTSLVLVTPLGIPHEVPSAAHALFATFMTKPVKPAQLFETLIRALFNAKTTQGKASLDAYSKQASAVRRPLQILLCEDNVIGQKVAVRILQQLGYQPELANNGREALAALDKRPYDLIFMDVMMPGMDGLETTRVIRERQKERKNPNYNSRIVIVAMTARALQGDRKKCLASGMDGYLVKPISPKDVRAIIEHWSAQINPPAPPEAASQTETVAQQATEESPVEMDRLTDAADNNPENLRDLVDLYLKQTTRQIAQLEAAIRTNNAGEVRQVAHSCAGASATLGMMRLLPLLRELEQQGAAGVLVNAQKLADDIAREFKRIQDFLSKHPSLGTTATAAHS